MPRRRVANPCPTIIDRLAAANSGRTRFYTGRPCKHGHLAERFVSGGACVECTNPPIRAIPPTYEPYRPTLILPVALDGAQRNELERLLWGWTAIKLREWGLVPFNG